MPHHLLRLEVEGVPPQHFAVATDRRLVVPDPYRDGAGQRSVADATLSLMSELLRQEANRNCVLLTENRSNAVSMWEALQRHRRNMQQKRRAGDGATVASSLNKTVVSTYMSIGVLPSYMHVSVVRDQRWVTPTIPDFPVDAEGDSVTNATRRLISSGLVLGKRAKCSVKRSSANHNGTTKGKHKKLASGLMQVSRQLYPGFFSNNGGSGSMSGRGNLGDDGDVMVVGDSDGYGDGEEATMTTVTAASSSSRQKEQMNTYAMVIPSIERLPRSISWIRYSRCIEGADQKVLRFLPYFGDDEGWNDERLETAVGEHFEKVVGEIELEINKEAIETAIVWAVDRYGVWPEKKQKKLRGDFMRGQRHIVHQAAGDAGAAEHIEDLAETESEKSTIVKEPYEDSEEEDEDEDEEVEEKHPSISFPELPIVCAELGVTHEQTSAAYHRVADELKKRSIELTAQSKLYEKERIKRFGNPELLSLVGSGSAPYIWSNEALAPPGQGMGPTGLGLLDSAKYKRVSVNYRNLFCRFCYIYDCNLHACMQRWPQKKSPFLPLPIPLEGMNEDPVDEAICRTDLMGASAIVRRRREARQLQLKNLAGASAVNEAGEGDGMRIVDDADEVGYDDDDANDAGASKAETKKKRKTDPGPLDFFYMDRRGTSKRQSFPHGVLSPDCSPNSEAGARLIEAFKASKAQQQGKDDDNDDDNDEDEEEKEEKEKGKQGKGVMSTETVTNNTTSRVGDTKVSLVNLKPKLYASLLGPAAASPALLKVEKALISHMALMYGDNIETIASLLGTRASTAVKTFMTDQGLLDEFCKPCDPNFAVVTRKPATGLDRKLNSYGKGAARHFIACKHKGNCSKENGCVCIENHMFCEKYCSCDFNCKHKFKGCRCTSGCYKLSCPCFAASRECDPDLCGKCGASIRQDYLPETEKFASSLIASGNGEIESAGGMRNLMEKALGCKNTSVRRGAEKKTLVGGSSVHGWGLFLLESANKDDFIIEYLGEHISQPEADRRGVIYDKAGLSYLFNINEDAVVDATRLGNNAKFINHGGDTANLRPKAVFIDGDYRVGFFAKRNIAPFEELTFDYGYADDVAPAWANKLNKWRRKSEGGTSKGANNGGEARESSDSAPPQKRGRGRPPKND